MNSVLDVLRVLQELLHAEHVYFACTSDVGLLCAVLHAGVPCTVLRCDIVQNAPKQVVTIQCTFVRGDDATFRRIVSYIAHHMTPSEAEVEFNMRTAVWPDIDVETMHARLTDTNTSFETLCEFAKALEPPQCAAARASVTHTNVHVWDDIIRCAVLMPLT